MIEKKFGNQVKEGNRFEFGKNWNSFLGTLDEKRISVATESIKKMLQLDSFEGKTFLDVGCGSGLFSLAAKRLNAKKVHSLDFDPNSVKCAQYLKEEYTDGKNWFIEEQSVLDSEYMASLDKYDIVYSWGVLHHTGNMALAFENVSKPVKEGGLLFISIYNDEGKMSKRWLTIKKLYNANAISRILVKYGYYLLRFTLFLGADILKLRNPFKRYIAYKERRGMSMLHDWKDWIGGLPFEVATPEYIFHFFKPLGFTLINLKTANGKGCNEMIFQKDSTQS